MRVFPEVWQINPCPLLEAAEHEHNEDRGNCSGDDTKRDRAFAHGRSLRVALPTCCKKGAPPKRALTDQSIGLPISLHTSALPSEALRTRRVTLTSSVDPPLPVTQQRRRYSLPAPRI